MKVEELLVGTVLVVPVEAVVDFLHFADGVEALLILLF